MDPAACQQRLSNLLVHQGAVGTCMLRMSGVSGQMTQSCGQLSSYVHGTLWVSLSHRLARQQQQQGCTSHVQQSRSSQQDVLARSGSIAHPTPAGAACPLRRARLSAGRQCRPDLADQLARDARAGCACPHTAQCWLVWALDCKCDARVLFVCKALPANKLHGCRAAGFSALGFCQSAPSNPRSAEQLLLNLIQPARLR